eukprot:g30.t1
MMYTLPIIASTLLPSLVMGGKRQLDYKDHLNIIGYWGNSGSAKSSIPLIKDVHEAYSTIIITFATVAQDASFTIAYDGPYTSDDTLKADLKEGKDKYGRPRLVLVSLGGQNGRFPAGVDSNALADNIIKFCKDWGLDGLDIDLEGSAILEAGKQVAMLEKLQAENLIISAVPEAAKGPLTKYGKFTVSILAVNTEINSPFFLLNLYTHFLLGPLMPYLSWLTPQFYNNAPNAVDGDFVSDCFTKKAPWNPPTNWQDASPVTMSTPDKCEDKGLALWSFTALSMPGHYKKKGFNLDPSAVGMSVPATPLAASNNNNWDIEKLSQQVASSGIKHVATWGKKR